jgi:hypothetical protein
VPGLSWNLQSFSEFCEPYYQVIEIRVALGTLKHVFLQTHINERYKILINNFSTGYMLYIGPLHWAKDNMYGKVFQVHV